MEKHFGNSLSYEEILEDIKICAEIDKRKQSASYQGKQVLIVDTGRYVNGKWIKTGTRTSEYYYSICFLEKNRKWLLSSKDDCGWFNSVKQAKDAARRAFGNGIKWIAE